MVAQDLCTTRVVQGVPLASSRFAFVCVFRVGVVMSLFVFVCFSASLFLSLSLSLLFLVCRPWRWAQVIFFSFMKRLLGTAGYSFCIPQWDLLPESQDLRHSVFQVSGLEWLV